MTRIPFWSDSATFSAACRQTLQDRKRPSPSFHVLVCLSKVRGVLAMRKFATAAPLGVKRSSGSETRFPTTVMIVSPATVVPFEVLAELGAEDLGAEDGLVEVELAVQLLHDGRLGLQV